VSTRELHELAMGLFEESLIARHAQDERHLRDLLSEAIKLECAAADSVADDLALEPTRSLLHRSAASMALQNFDTKTARRYVDAGLKGNVPESIKSELQTLSEQISVLDAEMTSYALKAPGKLTLVQEIIRRFTDNPPTDIFALANALGLSIIASDLRNDDGTDDAGEIVRDIRHGGFSGYSIRINRNDPHVRQRFTMAHEIAHFLLHRDRVQNRLRDDRMYRSGHGSTVETEANALAADLLMPRRVIGDLRNSRAYSVEELAEKFDVSLVAMKRRLGIRNSG
jgi:hypothetical protein